jgi:hypothetical protein
MDQIFLFLESFPGDCDVQLGLGTNSPIIGVRINSEYFYTDNSATSMEDHQIIMKMG